MGGVNYIDDGNDDGTNFGRSATDLIGFYGLTTPIAKATLTQAIAAAATEGTAIIGILELQVALKNLGLITTV